MIGLAVVGNLLGSAEVFEVELQNRQQGTQLARLGTIQTVAGAVLSALALLAQAPLLVFGGLPVLQALIRGWLLAVAVRAAKPLQLLKQASWDTSRALIKRGFPLLLAGLSVSLYMKSDMVMLQWLKGSSAVGQYSVAVRVAESLYFLPVILASTYMPLIGNRNLEFAENREMQQLYRLAWLLGICMMFTSILVLPIFIPVISGLIISKLSRP